MYCLHSIQTGQYSIYNTPEGWKTELTRLVGYNIEIVYLSGYPLTCRFRVDLYTWLVCMFSLLLHMVCVIMLCANEGYTHVFYSWCCMAFHRFCNMRFVSKEKLLAADLPMSPSEFKTFVRERCREVHEELRKK